MAKIIEVIVSPTGETTIQTKGFAGGECQQASKWLEQALGVSTADRKTGIGPPTTNLIVHTRETPSPDHFLTRFLTSSSICFFSSSESHRTQP